MTQAIFSEEPSAKTQIRSGTAARLAGLAPSTLRIWEHRYGVVTPPKSPSGQRVYSMRDVDRLRLIKRLTLEGHAIGTVAQLDIDALGALSSRNQVMSTRTQRVLVIGQSAASKLDGRLRPAPAAVFDDLRHAERDIACAGAADVLVVHVPVLHELMTEQVVALRNNLPVPNVIVVYSFGAEAVAETLRTRGVAVYREPVSGKELARLIVASRPVVEPLAAVVKTSPRHFSDADLVVLTEIPSLVACECPRHLAEIVTLLVNFELYSTECASANRKDADLHRHLYEVTSVARSMLEQALARLVIEEGLVL
jgi:DNA-binding transcriptional MerR regulator